MYFEEVRRHAGVDAAHAYGGLLATLTAFSEHHGIPHGGVPQPTASYRTDVDPDAAPGRLGGVTAPVLPTTPGAAAQSPAQTSRHGKHQRSSRSLVSNRQAPTCRFAWPNLRGSVLRDSLVNVVFPCNVQGPGVPALAAR